MELELQGKHNNAKVFTHNIEETVEIEKIVKPVYNFKSH